MRLDSGKSLGTTREKQMDVWEKKKKNKGKQKVIIWQINVYTKKKREEQLRKAAQQAR